MTLEFEVDVDYLTDGGINGMPMCVKLNDEGGEYTSTVYVNSSSYWHVVDENAKLRELVKRYHQLVTGTDELWSWQSVYEQLRDLGIEV